MTSVIPVATGGHEFFMGDNLPLGHELVAVLENPELTDTERRQSVATHVGELRAACAELLLDQDNKENAAVREGLNVTFLRSCQPLHGLLPSDEAREDLVSWLGQASDKQVINFCQKSVVRHRERDQKLQQLLPELVEQSTNWVENLAEQEIFPAVAVQKYKNAFASHSWVAGDILDTGAFCGIDTIYDALCDSDNKEVVILADFPSRYHAWRHLHLHEYTHAAIAEDGPGFAKPSIPGGARFIEEVFASHVVQVAAANMKRPDEFAPTLRNDVRRGPYETERALFAAINAACAKPVTLAEMSQAAFSPKGLTATVQRSITARLGHATQKLFPQWRHEGIHALQHMYAVYSINDTDLQYKKVSEWAAYACQQVGIEFEPEF